MAIVKKPAVKWPAVKKSAGTSARRASPPSVAKARGTATKDAAPAIAPSNAPPAQDVEGTVHGPIVDTGTRPLSGGGAVTIPTDTATPAAGSALPGAQVIPGSEVLGRGIYIRPRVPYELKDFLLKRQTTKSRNQRIFGFYQPYEVPEDCEVNDSPPLPADRSTGQTIIEESWNRFGRELMLNVNAAASAKVLSIDATSFHGSSLRSEEDSYYALRSAFIPFWSVYLPRVDRGNVIEELKNIEQKEQAPASDKPTLPDGPYDPLCRALYARIFDTFGTHYVRSAWLGGKASLVFVVTKSSALSKEDVKAGIEVTFAGMGKGGASTERTETQERMRSNSSCTVFGSGGDPTELAKLTSLQPEQYDRWVDGVKYNPEIIEFGVAGIWTLLKDEVKAEALRQAYVQETRFTPLNAVVPVKDWLIFTKGDEAFDYALTSKYGASRLYVLSCLFNADMIKEPEKVRDRLAQIFEETTDSDYAVACVQAAGTAIPALNATAGDAAKAMRDLPQAELKNYLVRLLNVLVLSGESIHEQEPLRKLFAPREKFRGSTKTLMKNTGGRVFMLNRLLLEDAFPDELARRSSRPSLLDYLPPLKDYRYRHFLQPHAAFSLYGFGEELESKLYLFRWRECLRVDVGTATVDEGYPRTLDDEWPDVDFDRIDAAVCIAPDRLYFFRGGEYIRADMRNGQWKIGNRDTLKNRWPGVIFDRIDTAVYWGGNKVYFFSDDQYIRYDVASHRADPGYPKFLSSNYVEDWELFD